MTISCCFLDKPRRNYDSTPTPIPDTPDQTIADLKIHQDVEPGVVDRQPLPQAPSEDSPPKYDVHEAPGEQIQPKVMTVAALASPSYDTFFEDLNAVDCLMISRKLRFKNILSSAGKSECEVRTSDNSAIYTVEDATKWWQIIYALRPLDLRITDRKGTEIMRLLRPHSLIMRMFPCAVHSMEVVIPPCKLIGTVNQIWTPLRPIYEIKRATGETIFKIQGPRVIISCFKDVRFSIRRMSGELVGVTCKKWQGLCNMMFIGPFSGRLGLAFEKSVTNEEKALLLAASFLIDYTYYEM